MALITVAEAAKMCGVATQTILNWGERGIITLKKTKGKDGRKWYHANKEQIDEICSVSQDIQETKKILEQQLEGLRDATRKAIEKRKQTLIDIGILNPIYMVSSKSLLISMIELACKCDTINEREEYILKRFVNGDTFEEISDDLCFSRERLRQIFERACHRIKNAKNVVEKINDYDRMKAEYETIMDAGKMLQKENERLKEKLEIKQKEDLVKSLQAKKPYLDEIDNVCKLLSKRLRECNLSIRALNCLRSANIETIGDLVQYAKTDLLKFRNFGRKSLTELDDFIEDNGLHWGMDVEKFYLERAKMYFIDNEDKDNDGAIV